MKTQVCYIWFFLPCNRWLHNYSPQKAQCELYRWYCLSLQQMHMNHQISDSFTVFSLNTFYCTLNLLCCCWAGFFPPHCVIFIILYLNCVDLKQNKFPIRDIKYILFNFIQNFVHLNWRCILTIYVPILFLCKSDPLISTL